ncbi:MAG TPA: DNA adenine methylase [Verrucomicrobiae bacterium]|nr:DNA adenine methylase [Verrucomicrobiae bacterium]
MDESINSPFRYAGGKFYARKLILEHIPAHSTFVEVFAGGASIFFAKPKVATNIINDKDKELMNAYRVIRDNPEELIAFLKRKSFRASRIPEELTKKVNFGEPLPASKRLHTFFKNEYEPTNKIERAGRWYYLNRTSYSGIMNHINMYWGYGDKYSMQPKNWAANITRTSKKLQGVTLSNLDFEEVIDNAQDNALLFVDPPYFSAEQDKFYTCAFDFMDHERLQKCLFRNRSRLKFFLTYDNEPEVRELYSWATEMHDKEWNYCIQRTDDQIKGTERKGERYKGKELFILNYTNGFSNKAATASRAISPTLAFTQLAAS